MRKLSLHTEEWATKVPFRITGLSRDTFEVVVVELLEEGQKGKGEGLPVRYLSETVESLCLQIHSIANHLERGVGREDILQLLPPGGARNAVDGALWDLEAKLTGKSIWELTGIEPRPLTTALTIGIEETPQAMADRATEALDYPLLKIKVDAGLPIARIAAIRAARPDSALIVDANQAWDFEQLVQAAPKLAEMGVKLIEQPLPRGADEQLECYASPVPLMADESCQHRRELDQAGRRYQVINIKLDKCGGLTEALRMAQEATSMGLELYAGNMGGTSLSMAPAFVLAQLCQYVELDGPLILKHDRLPGLVCRSGVIDVPPSRLWG